MTNFNLSEKIERLLLSKANFHPFLQLNCSNFKETVCGLRFTKYVKKLSSKGSLRSKNQKRFRETIIHEIFETSSSFHVKLCTAGKVQYLFFKSLLLALTRFFQQEDQPLGYYSMKLTHFSDISQCPKILSLKSLGKS